MSFKDKHVFGTYYSEDVIYQLTGHVHHSVHEVVESLETKEQYLTGNKLLKKLRAPSLDLKVF